MITIRVHGTPAGQGSKRHVGHGVMVESSKAVKPWRDAVRSEAQHALEAGAAPILTGPVSLDLVFYLARPKAHYRTGRHAYQLRPDAPVWVATTPDIDKTCRAVGDALTDAGIWGDDRQVAALNARKFYATGPEQAPGVLITITPL